jgi:hypothetical protein
MKRQLFVNTSSKPITWLRKLKCTKKYSLLFFIACMDYRLFHTFLLSFFFYFSLLLYGLFLALCRLLVFFKFISCFVIFCLDCKIFLFPSFFLLLHFYLWIVVSFFLTYNSSSSLTSFPYSAHNLVVWPNVLWQAALYSSAAQQLPSCHFILIQPKRKL